MEKKRQYALPNPKLVEDSLEKLWKYTEKKAGDINEWCTNKVSSLNGR